MRFPLFVLFLVLAQANGHAAEAAAAHGESAGAITQIIHDFGITVPSLLAQILNFSIVAFILWRFAFKPVLATLDERQKKISDGLRYAEEMKAKLEATQQESAVILKQGATEAARIVEEARRAAKDYLDRHTQETALKVNDMIAKGRQALELEQKKMMADARTEIARLVVVTTERVMARKLSDADRTSYGETAAHELSNV